MSELQWQSVLYQLRSRIISGVLIGGTKLRASHLASELGVSRTPVSEALIKLEGEGLLIRDKSGFTVRSFALEEVFDAIDLRGLLEGAAVQKAAERGVEGPDLRQLRELLLQLDEVVTEGNVVAYDQLNVEFHNRLTALSGSEILIAEIKRSYLLPFAGPSSFPTQQGDSERFRSSLINGQQHHRQVVEAISNREGARAFSLMREHARLAHQNVYAAIEARESAPQLALVNSSGCRVR